MMYWQDFANLLSSLCEVTDFIFFHVVAVGGSMRCFGRKKNVPSRPTRLFHHHQQFSHSFLHVFNYSQITLCIPSRRRSKIIVFIARYLSCIYRLVTEFDEGGSLEVNTPGCYPTVCVELGIDGLAVNAVLQV